MWLHYVLCAWCNKYHTSIYYLVLDFKLVGSCQVTPRGFLLSKILIGDCCTKAICFVAFGIRRLASHPSFKVSAHLIQMCENGTSCIISIVGEDVVNVRN